jgi:TRAP-type C4-dicarboxylate transport system permease small subunit
MSRKNHQPTKAAQFLLRTNLFCGLLSGLALLLMMVAGAADVIGTNLDLLGLPSQPIPAAFEFMATMMVVTVFLATSLGQARRSHIQVEALVKILPGPLFRIVTVIQHGLSALFWGLIAWYGWKSGLHSVSVGEYATGLVNFPIWPARLVLGFGATLMFVQCIFDLLSVYSARFDARDMSNQSGTMVS